MTTIDELRQLFLLDGLDDGQLGELLAAGQEVDFEEGDELFHEGSPADFWWLLLDGRVELVRHAGREEPVVMQTMDRPGVWAGGFRAWDDSGSYLATARGASTGRMFRVPSAALGSLARAWFPFGVHLIQGFFSTVRRMDTLSRQRESLIALGTLAAGLAHEINNPASAAARAVDALQVECDTLLSSLVRLAERSLSTERFADLDALRRDVDSLPNVSGALEIADREEALIDWLDEHGAGEAAWRVAPPLAAAGVDAAWCERAAALLDGDTLESGLEWIASTISARSLLSEIKEASGRITGLVGAVKSYSQVDRASLQEVDVTEGIESTLVILGHKLGEDVLVVRDYGPHVPQIEANPGELNQVWTNLLDNAIDAIDGAGTLRISTRADADDVVVEIGDTGPGMPAEVLARAFEPFFTTKDVGRGTGLGLDISRRIIVDRHHGEITIDPRPGETVLRVRLPQRRRAVGQGTRPP